MRLETRRVSRALVCALTMLTALACGSAARADVLTVNATGTVAASCTIAATTAFGSPDLSSSGSIGAQATVNCNTPFKVNALSANGAIKTSSTAPANFTSLQPYSFSLSVPLETGGPASATCASSTLVAGQSGCALSPANGAGLSSAGKASINKVASLTVAWTLPTLPTRLVAGAYSDTITLTVTAAP